MFARGSGGVCPGGSAAKSSRLSFRPIIVGFDSTSTPARKRPYGEDDDLQIVLYKTTVCDIMWHGQLQNEHEPRAINVTYIFMLCHCPVPRRTKR